MNQNTLPVMLEKSDAFAYIYIFKCTQFNERLENTHKYNRLKILKRPIQKVRRKCGNNLFC